MSRYIDIDKVLKELHLNHKDVIYIDKRDTAKRIEKIKGIDIVRCKECKHFEKNDSILRGKWWCDLWADTIEDDGYCSYGEREGE